MEETQKKYYRETASKYASMHVHDGDAHYHALDLIEAMAKAHKIESFLDIGCGSGRGVGYLREKQFDAVGLEPSEDLLNEARKTIPADKLVQGNGESLPFADKSFDAVMCLGILHHVKEPSRIISEMTRVARKAVFVSDSNRFGQGGFFARRLKLALYLAKLWPLANWVKTRGKGFIITEGDGLTYSYSVYDSYKQMMTWSPKVFLLPTENLSGNSWFSPLLTSSHVLLAAIKEAAPSEG